MTAFQHTAYRSRLAGAAFRHGIKGWESKTNRELLEFLAKAGKLMEFWEAFPSYFDEALFRKLVLKS